MSECPRCGEPAERVERSRVMRRDLAGPQTEESRTEDSMTDPIIHAVDVMHVNAAHIHVGPQPGRNMAFNIGPVRLYVNRPDIAGVARRLREIADQLERSSYVVRTDLRHGSGIAIQRADGMVAPFGAMSSVQVAAAALRDGRMNENDLSWRKP